MSTNFDAQPQWCECNLIFFCHFYFCCCLFRYTTEKKFMQRWFLISTRAHLGVSFCLSFTFVLMQSLVIFMIISFLLEIHPPSKMRRTFSFLRNKHETPQRSFTFFFLVGYNVNEFSVGWKKNQSWCWLNLLGDAVV